MARSGLLTVAALASLVACNKGSTGSPAPEPAVQDSRPSAATTILSPAPSASGRRPIKAGETCAESDYDCETVSGCASKCMSLFDGHGKRSGAHCFLIAPNGKAGASPCVADVEGFETSYYVKEGAERGVACDVWRNDAYCDQTSRVCTKTKALGAACSISAECGKNRECDPKARKCVAAAAVGAPCKEHPCVVSANCDSKTKVCAPRKPDGAKCGLSDECLSLNCGGTCEPAKPPAACTL